MAHIFDGPDVFCYTTHQQVLEFFTLVLPRMSVYCVVWCRLWEESVLSVSINSHRKDDSGCVSTDFTDGRSSAVSQVGNCAGLVCLHQAYSHS